MSFLTRVRALLSTDRPRVAPVGRAALGPWMDYTREVPAGWQAALDAATYTPGLARLWLHWVPGDPWQPVHRWFVFQMQPWWAVAQPDMAHIRRELTGPHPRTDARLEYVVGTERLEDGTARRAMRPRVRGGPCRFIDRTQWVLHHHYKRLTGERVFPRYCWVIQGDAGGHPFQCAPEEQQVRVAQGLVADSPSAGDLPYAPFDARVLRALESLDLWRYAHGLAEPMTNAAQLQIARLSAYEREAHKLIWARKEQVGREFADGFAHAARQDGLHRLRWAPVQTKEDKARGTIDVDRMKHEYIHSTTWEDAS